MFYLADADLDQQISRLGLRTVLIAATILVIATVIAALYKNRNKKLRLPLFLAMAGSIVISAIVLLASTVYLNVKSDSKGPVHWHADIEFWSCDAELELRDPQGALSNKIGSATFHEHNDKRMHLEGVVVRKATDASLVKFMSLTGGYLAKDRIAIPLNDAKGNPEANWYASAQNDKTDGDRQRPENFGMAIGGGQWIEQTNKGQLLVLKNGEYCGGSGQPAQVQVFVYHFNKDENTYSQAKLADSTSYVMRDEQLVPPGDCVIVEFDVPKDRTNKICRQYGIRDEQRCIEFGVSTFNPKLCNIREVSSSGGSD